MDLLNTIVLIGALLFFVSILISAVSTRVGAPLLLVFLVLGMLAGDEGPGNIQFQDFRLAYVIGTVALAIILLDGGLRTRTESFRVGLKPAVSLATVGVVLTSAIVGVFTSWLLDISLVQGLLVGAIVGSTDAAAVFSLLHGRGINLEQRVGVTLEIESGTNDPMAIFLTIILITALTTGESVFGWLIVVNFLQQLGLGIIAGYAGGRLLAILVNRLVLPPGLYPLLVTTGGLSVYAMANSVGGSGFLAIYLLGLVLGNSRLRSAQNILRVHDGLAWLSQIGMFLILGLLVTPSALLPSAPVAMLIALLLIFVARPVAVMISLLPFRFAWKEQLYISWVGLRGAVPIILALFPLLAGVENAQTYFNIAFFVVLVSLLVQGWSVAPFARLLKLGVPLGPEPVLRVDTAIPGHPECEILIYQLTEKSELTDRSPAQLKLPGSACITAIVRNGVFLVPTETTRLEAGDYVHILVEAVDVDKLNRLFTSIEYVSAHEFFGDFTLDAGARLADIASMYGFHAVPGVAEMTIGEYLNGLFHKAPVVGDRASFDNIEFVVREIEQGRITRVGLK
ncbi:MAG: potassium/proton antiporter, partial [Gammaproteobacteria bacterium]